MAVADKTHSVSLACTEVGAISLILILDKAKRKSTFFKTKFAGTAVLNNGVYVFDKKVEGFIKLFKANNLNVYRKDRKFVYEP